MSEPFLFKVFVDDKGSYGNPGSVIIDDNHDLDEDTRTKITAEIGHDETVFIDDLATNKISIYHSYGRVRFAGSVLIGLVWQLSQIKEAPIKNLLCDLGEIPCWQEGDTYWLRASLENHLGNWEYQQVKTPSDVDKIKLSDTKGWKKMVWAWQDEDQGLIRARTFASKINIPEVQGNGSGSMNLAGFLQRDIRVNHGDGSVIFARPAPNNSAELGGKVIAL